MISLLVTLLFATDKPPGPVSYIIDFELNWIRPITDLLFFPRLFDLISIVEPIGIEV